MRVSQAAIRTMLLVLAFALPALTPDSSRAAELDLASEVVQVENLLAEGQARPAIDRLKPLLREHPGRPALARLLAKAYLADDNPFWAERTLAGALQHDPDDWESRTWLVWVQLAEGDLALAHATLDEVAAPDADPGRVRFALLEALIAHSSGEHDSARQALAAARSAETMFSEDLELARHLRRLELPGWSSPLELRTGVTIGHTSNALAGSPTDPGEEGVASALGRVNLFGRLVGPGTDSPRPVVELAVNGFGLEASEAEQLSSLEIIARPGLVVGSQRPLFVGYRSQRLFLNRHPSRFSDAHRLEAELELGRFNIFAGGGHRSFFEDRRRSRDEIDGGIGASLRLFGRHPLLVGAVARSFDAESPAYDQLGATALAVLRLGLGRRLSTRVSLTASWDDYPHSGGSEGEEVFGSSERREDLVGRIALELWRDFHGVSLGLRYQYGRRDSTIDMAVGNDYDYDEHRAMLTLRWRSELDPWAPAGIGAPDHVPVDWGLGAGPGTAGDERIQDLLRQDEDIRRATGCAAGP